MGFHLCSVKKEIKFLVKPNFNINRLKITSIRYVTQGYIHNDVDIRVKIVSQNNRKKSFLIYKKGMKLKKTKVQTVIPNKLASDLLQVSVKKITKKIYTYIDTRKQVWELEHVENINLWIAVIKYESKDIKLPNLLRDFSALFVNFGT